MEPFSAVLLCTDPGSLTITQKILEEYGVAVKVANTTPAAGEIMKGSRFDLAIYDADVPGAMDLAPARQAVAAPKMVFVLARGSRINELRGKRVHFVMQKPFSADLFARSLRAAYGSMIRERRASFRHPVKINPVSALLVQETGNQALQKSVILDMSQSGLCIQTLEVLPQGATLQIDFHLPDGKELIHVTGNVMWTRASGRTGIKFAHVPQAEMKQLGAWLESMLPYEAEMMPRLAPPAVRREVQGQELQM